MLRWIALLCSYLGDADDMQHTALFHCDFFSRFASSSSSFSIPFVLVCSRKYLSFCLHLADWHISHHRFLFCFAIWTCTHKGFTITIVCASFRAAHCDAVNSVLKYIKKNRELFFLFRWIIWSFSNDCTVYGWVIRFVHKHPKAHTRWFNFCVFLCLLRFTFRWQRNHNSHIFFRYFSQWGIKVQLPTFLRRRFIAIQIHLQPYFPSKWRRFHRIFGLIIGRNTFQLNYIIWW